MAPTSRSRCDGRQIPKQRRRSPRARHPDGRSTGSSSRPSCRCCSPDSTRPSRSTATASAPGDARTMRCARRSGTSRSGRRWVVDVDLEQFFDRVNHDVLMGRLAKRIADKRLLGLIRRYLEAGVHGQRGGDGAARGDAARRSALAAAWRTCSSTKWTRSWRSAATLSRATPTTATCTCGRGGRASGCMAGAAAPVREAPAAGQRSEERGGAAVGPQVPGLQLLGRPGGERSSGASPPRPLRR